MSLTTELEALLGTDAVTDSTDELAARAHDHAPRALLDLRRGRLETPSGAVVTPRSADQVAALMRWAHESRTAVVPFGAGSGVCAAITPVTGAVIVDMRAMDQIVDLDDRSLLVRAQAGIMGPVLTDGLGRAGYRLGHEPQSLAISTLGGWVATRACGQLSARYGGIEDLIAGLEAVLPSGEIVRAKPSPRSSTGPALADLMVGSEGTLGIVTEATLRLHPMPEGRSERAVGFEHMADGVAACRALTRSELQPTLVRLYDREDSFIAFSNFEVPPDGPVLIMAFEGRDAEGRAEEAAALAGGVELSPDLVAYWWEHRNDAVETFRKVMAGEGILGPHAMVDTMEVSGTWTTLRDLYHSMKETLGREADFVGCHLSHVYRDGACLYFTMGSSCTDDDAAERMNVRWWEAGMRACLDAGGSISHHHGIGRLKAAWLHEELGGWLTVLKAVKAAVDPHGIMNPGALGL